MFTSFFPPNPHITNFTLIVASWLTCPDTSVLTELMLLETKCLSQSSCLPLLSIVHWMTVLSSTLSLCHIRLASMSSTVRWYNFLRCTALSLKDSRMINDIRLVRLNQWAKQGASRQIILDKSKIIPCFHSSMTHHLLKREARDNIQTCRTG